MNISSRKTVGMIFCPYYVSCFVGYLTIFLYQVGVAVSLETRASEVLISNLGRYSQVDRRVF